MEEIRVSIIGKTGVGKSALGNALLQKDTFKSQQKTTSVTSECGSGQRHLQLNDVDTLLKVVDTPGLFDTCNSNKTIAKEIVKSINLLSPGPHLFIMVFRIDLKLSQEDIKVLEYFKNTFGEMIDKFAVVVFTGKDLLVDRSEDCAIDEFHTHLLSTFSDVFKHRPSAMINNGRDGKIEEKMKDVHRVLQILQETIWNNEGDFYKNDMYEEAKILFEARIRDEEDGKQKALAKIEQLEKQLEKQNDQNQIWQKEREQLEKQNEIWLKEREQLTKKLEKHNHQEQIWLKEKEQLTKKLEKHNHQEQIWLKEKEQLTKQLENDQEQILPSGQSYIEQTSTSAYHHGDLPHHRAILTANSELLRTTLADGIETVARKLNERFVVHDYQLTSILKEAAKQPEDGVSKLIEILKCNTKHFDAFIQCLSDLEYTGLVQKLTGRSNQGIMSGKTKNRKTVTQLSPSTNIDTGSALHGSTEVRVILVGKTGRGKSTLGNSLLRSKNFFRTSASASSVTEKCRTGYLDIQDGKTLVVVDTPGFFDTRVNNEVTSKELVRCIALACPGPHAFLFVLSIDRFTQEELDTVDHLKKLFGEDVTKFVIVVFNHKDSLDYEEKTLEDHIRQSPPQLQSLIDRCGGRMATINNRAPPASKENDVNEILSLVEQTILSNGGEHYNDAMFVAAEKVYQNKIREQEELTKRKLREKFRKETEENDGVLVTFAKGIQATTTKASPRSCITM